MSSPRQAYVNGAWIEDRGLTIPVSDPGFAQGVTITERLRTFGGRVWRQADHLQRLKRSAETIGLSSDVTDELNTAIAEFVRRHESTRVANAVDGIQDDWTVIAFATPGLDGEPTRVVHGMPLPFQRWAHQYVEGVKVWVSDHREISPSSWPPGLKCRSRMHYYLADRQASQREPGSQAILLDQEGFISQSPIANVAIYNEREGIVTPRVAKVLPGISLATLEELAKSKGMTFAERDIRIEELASAEEVWLTSTSSCLLPVVRCNGEPIGRGVPGAGYRRMLKAWNGVAGLDIAEQARRFAKLRS